MATHSSILTWEIPIDQGAWWATVHGVTELDTEHKHTHRLLKDRHLKWGLRVNPLPQETPKQVNSTVTKGIF